MIFGIIRYSVLCDGAQFAVTSVVVLKLCTVWCRGFGQAVVLLNMQLLPFEDGRWIGVTFSGFSC